MTDEQHMYWATATILIVFFICVTVVVVMELRR